jgi:Xaa-Pro aminopeptidase
MTWPQGATRAERLEDARRTHGLDVLLSLMPENSTYLSGLSNYVATHWRVPGLFSVAVGAEGRAVATSDFALDPAAPSEHAIKTYASWAEVVDARGVAGGSIEERVAAARPGPVVRPAQFDFDAVARTVIEAIRAVDANPRRIGADLALVDAGTLARLRALLPNAEWTDATGVFADLRAIKDPDEIARLRLAAELAQAGIAGAVSRLALGQTELAVNANYQIAVLELARDNPRFAAFRQAEGGAAVGFGAASRHVVAPGETIKFDVTVDVGGYHSDLGRTYAIAPIAEQRTVHAALLGALQAMTAAAKPGVAFSELHRIGIAAMRAAGFASYSRGHLGHSDGLTHNFEEPPFVAADEPRPLAPGMVLSLELPYYLHGVGAFQLERMLVVGETACELLDDLPFDFELFLD